MFCSTDPRELPDSALAGELVGLHAIVERAKARITVLAAEWDVRRAWADDGSLSAAACLSRMTDIPAPAAREQLRVSNKLRSMPGTAAAHLDGSLGWAKVRILANAVNERTEEAFERDEAVLLEQAARLDVERFQILVRHWMALVDQDGANASADAMHHREFVTLSESWQGEGFLAGRLSPESRAIVRNALDQIADELYRADTESLRTGAQRKADALVEMARRAMATTAAAEAGVTVEPPRPLVVVTVDMEVLGDRVWLNARLDDGTPLTAADALRLACEADVVRVLTNGASEPLDLGRSTRVPNRAQRRALAAMWPTCIYPGCDAPFSWCDIHHIVHWILGGPTDIANEVPLCRRHHRLHHLGRYDLARAPDGSIVVTDADGNPVGTANPTFQQLLAPLRDIRRDITRPGRTRQARPPSRDPERRT